MIWVSNHVILLKKFDVNHINADIMRVIKILKLTVSVVCHLGEFSLANQAQGVINECLSIY